MKIQAKDYALIIAISDYLPALFDVLQDDHGYTHYVRFPYGRKLYEYIGLAVDTGKPVIRYWGPQRAVSRQLKPGRTVILVHK